MKVFLSWSGTKSKELAEKLRDWLPDVVQSVEPFVSTRDISIGDRPLSVLASELESTSFGIVCLTQQNKLTPWITFEAGALSKIIDNSRVIPLLIDLRVSDLTGPLSQFQAVDAGDEDQMFMLIKAIAASSPPPLITMDRLKRTFHAFWPTVLDKVNELRQERDEGIKKDNRSEQDILEELLVLARRNDQQIARISNREVLSENIAQQGSSLRNLASSDPASRMRKIVMILREEENIYYEYRVNGDELLFKAIGYTRKADQEEQPDPAVLRRTLQLLARVYEVPILVEDSPFGRDAFPPF